VAECRIELQVDNAKSNSPRSDEDLEPLDLEHFSNGDQELPDLQRIAPSSEDLVPWYELE
jgi:hypothetical protein